MLFAMVGIDLILVAFALELAGAARFGGNLVSYLGLPQMPVKFALVILICELSLYLTDLYDFRLTLGEIATRLLQAFSLAFLIVSGIYYIVPILSLGRGITETTVVLAFILTLSWRAMVAEPPKMTSVRF